MEINWQNKPFSCERYPLIFCYDSLLRAMELNQFSLCLQPSLILNDSRKSWQQ